MPVDKLGQRYDVGDLVLVAISDRYAQMVFMEVDEIVTHDKDGNQLLEEQIYDHETGQLVGGTPTFHVKGTPARSTHPLDGSRRRSRQTTFTKAYNIIALPNHTLADIQRNAHL